MTVLNHDTSHFLAQSAVTEFLGGGKAWTP